MASGQVENPLIASQQGVSSDTVPAPQPPISDNLLFLVPTSLVLIWSIATAIFLGLPKLVQGRQGKVKAAHKIPCYGCQYFTNNPYLRCAVRPETVLTEAAIGCSDFQPQPQPEKKVGQPRKRG